MKNAMGTRVKDGCAAALRWMDAHALLLGALTALLLSGGLALYNVSSGPLCNLHDIGGWHNRALFIGMTAAAHGALLLLCAGLSRVGYARTALRQVILTAGLYIMLLAINQKAYAYLGVMQPVVRAMDAGGLAAGMAAASGVSAPMLLLTYLVTRGPVYDLYLLKLLSIACVLLIFLLAAYAADRHGLGLRTEMLLALCVVLPQGFLNAAFSALPETAAVVLLAVSLTLAFQTEKPHMLAAALCFGAACALSGAALYALPVYIALTAKGRMKGWMLVAAAGVAVALCVPAVLCGVPAIEALGSLLCANLGLPPYAGGSPGLLNLVPRAAVEEIPQYAPILRHFAELDTVTHAQPYYTQAHFEQLCAGYTLAGMAAYVGLCALMGRMRDKTPLHRAMLLTLGALIICPNVTSAAWLGLDVLCLYAILAEPKLRLPSCLLLFATTTSSIYPATEEVMLPMIAAFALCLLALCMLLDVIPMEKGRESSHE